MCCCYYNARGVQRNRIADERFLVLNKLPGIFLAALAVQYGGIWHTIDSGGTGARGLPGDGTLKRQGGVL